MELTHEQFGKFIEDTRGRWFSARFVKADGSVRRMVCRTGVTKYRKGVGLPYDPAQRRQAIVWDAGKRAYRTLPLDRVLHLKCGRESVGATG